MQTLSFLSAPFSLAYNISCASLPSKQGKSALYPTLCKVPHKGKTTRHSHFESEIFFITQGLGLLDIGGAQTEVKAGDLVKIPSFSEHELINLGDEELRFLSVYSEDFETAQLAKKFLITTAPPTPNGPLHLGHMSGPYLAGDILGRYLKMKGRVVQSFCGTDDNQNYVSERAQNLKLNPEDFRTQMRQMIQQGLAHFDIHYNEFIEPKASASYQKQIEEFHLKAIAKGVVQRKVVSFPYCENCELKLIDAKIEGLCPHCGASSRGGCESCGHVVPPYELLQKKCARCTQEASSQEEEVYVFPLSSYLPLIQKDLEALNLSPRLRELATQVFQEKELEVLLTHQGEIHVWYEMAASYEKFSVFEDFWIHSFGFDNAFYYLFFIPALHRAMNPKARLPDAVVTNEFLTLQGAKFSTSRNHAIWAHEFQGNVDHLRLFLALQRPATRSTDFTMEKFQQFSDELKEMIDMIIENKKGISGTQENQITIERLGLELDRALHPEKADLRSAARLLLNFMDQVLEKKDKAMTQALAKFLSPFMPTEAERILQ